MTTERFGVVLRLRSFVAKASLRRADQGGPGLGRRWHESQRYRRLPQEGVGVAFVSDGGAGAVAGMDDGGVGELHEFVF